jgi:glycosyltransferase involved in cell wall biosynthesis
MTPKVLVFSSLLPIPIDRGDRNRLFHILHLLAGVGRVRLLAVERAWEPPVQDLACLAPIEVRTTRLSAADVVANGMWAALTGRPYLITRYASARINRFVREQFRDFQPDVFWGFQAPSFPFLAKAGGVRRVIDIVDSPSRYAALTRRAPDISWKVRLGMAVQWRLASYERRAIEVSDATLVNSRADLAYLRALVPTCANRLVWFDNCVPRSLMDEPRPVVDKRPPQLLFVGNLAYAPNAAAVRVIVNDIVPRVRERHPDAELLVCGARGGALARELGQRPGVHFLGFVADLKETYRRASVMLVPVPLAGGTQYKLLESLAVGLPAVVSRVSAEVTGVADNREVLIGNTPQEYAEAVNRLLVDDKLAERLSKAGRAFIERNHTWESKQELVARLIGVPG